MSVKAKFKCTRSEQLPGQDSHTVTLIPVIDDSNEKAAEQFVEGEEYFVDFTSIAEQDLITKSETKQN